MTRLVWLLSKFIYSHAVFHFPCPHLGYLPLCPLLPFSVAYREEPWVGTLEVMHKRNSLSFSPETEPEGVPMNTHTVGAKFCLPERQDSGLHQKYYSSPLWPLSRFEKCDSHWQMMSLFILEQGYEVKHVPTAKENGNLEDSADCLLKGGIAIMGGQTLRSARLHFSPMDIITHFGSKARLWKTGASPFKWAGMLEAALTTSHLKGNFTWGRDELWKKWMICFDSTAYVTNLQETAMGQVCIFISCSAIGEHNSQFCTCENPLGWAFIYLYAEMYTLYCMLRQKLSEINEPQRSHIRI